MTTPSKPAKLKITSVENPSLVLEAQFNPTQLRKVIRPVWAEHKVPGLSHPVQHYSYTDARQVSFDLEFDADAFEKSSDKSLQLVQYALNFLEAMCYTSKSAQGIKQGQPNRLLFQWPKVMSWTTRIAELDLSLDTFNVEGSLVRFTAKISLVEIRDVRLYSEDILEGSQASSVLAPPDGFFT